MTSNRRPKREKVDPALTTLPSGTLVNVRKDNGDVVVTRTRSLPWRLGHGDWVVSLDGISGGYALSRITVA
jgi:hypothetical protein